MFGALAYGKLQTCSSIIFLMRLFFTLFLFCTCFSSYAQIIGFSQNPKGGFSQFSIDGWSCEVGSTEAVTIRLHAGTSLATSEIIAQTEANKDSEGAINERCQSDGRYRFQIVVPQDIVFDYQNTPIFITAKQGEQTKQIFGSQQFILPSHPEVKLKGFLDGVVEVNSAFFATGWACQTNSELPVSLTFITNGFNAETVQFLSEKQTGVVAEEGVQRACQTSNGRHRFRVQIPNEVIELYAGKPLRVIAHSNFDDSKFRLSTFKNVSIPKRFPLQKDRKPNILVFFTDDQGYADLGIQNEREDIKTPNIDSLAMNGARFTHGYITAPQCSPSRASMLTGMYQNRFALDENRHIPLSLDATLLASKFRDLGYKTGMLGKWHLEVMNNSVEWGAKHYPDAIPFRTHKVPQEVRNKYHAFERGFDDVLAGYTGSFVRNVNRNGNKIKLETYRTGQFRVDLVSEQSLSFIDKHWNKPFYLYVSHYAPHVPLEAIQKYLDQFPEDMPQRRRYALAMMKAVDDGVGNVIDKLTEYNLLDNTLIFFISDNGAPLGDDMTDTPIKHRGEAWNGSRNDPYTGEKGMLTEGALRVPFIAHWPKNIPAGLEIDTPVSSLDAAYTSAMIAGVSDLDNLDGIDLMPLFSGDSTTFDKRPLFWRFYYQRAVRKGKWKYMQAGIAREYLFDMSQTYPESINLIENYPEIAKQMRELYWQWAGEMPRSEPLVEIPKPFADRVDRYLPKP